MGCCHSQTPHSLNQLPITASFFQDNQISSKIIEDFIISKTIKQKIKGLAFTSVQLREIIEDILVLVKKLEESETSEEKKLIDEVVKAAQTQKLRYYRVSEKFSKIIKKENIRPQSLSRIYHSLANASKKEKIERQSSFIHQSQKQKKDDEKIEVKFIETNDYNLLSSEQVEEIIKLQAVCQKVQSFSTRFKFKFDSIQSNSEDMNKLLAYSFSYYESDFKGLKYDLAHREIMKIAQISRNACNYSDSGIVLLLIYLVNACQHLEKSGKPVQMIQKAMQECVWNISKEYPPGQGLKEEQQDLSKALKRLEIKQKFSHKSYSLQSRDKQLQLEQVILANAKIAKEYKNDFEELLQQTCLQLSLKVIVGLKLNPDRPNQKAMVRIKEKILIPKDSKNQVHINKQNIKQTIDGQEEQYKRKVDHLLSGRSQITFKISDMLRGKCVFTSIPDIILTIDKIKAFVLKDQKKRFRIVEIQSRFTNLEVPISDVTLKIAINEEIVTELQLTIQSNAAAYNFAHKIYQLQRAKMFSKIKIVHNYFEEFQAEFKELVIKALNNAETNPESKHKSPLQASNKPIVSFKASSGEQEKQKLSLNQAYALIKSHSSTIRHYCSIIDVKVKEFDETFEEVIANVRQKLLPAKLLVSIDKDLQKMMLILFNKQMGSWQSQLGQQIDFLLQSNCSELLKATLLYFFLRTFDISKEIHRMLQFHPDYMYLAEQLKYDKYSGEKFTLLYLQKVFNISKIFELTKTTARIFYQTQQLQNMAITNYQNQTKFVVEKIVKGVVFEEDSPESVQFLLQLISSYFINRDEDNHFYDEFDIYYEMLLKLLQQQPNLDSGISSLAKLLRAKKLLQNKSQDCYKQAQTVLRQIKDDFKKREEHYKWLQCELLLAEIVLCSQNTSIESFQEAYEKVMQSATALGLNLRGETVANSEWRVYQQMKTKNLNENENKSIVKHLNKAITQSSRSEGRMFILKMKTALSQGYKIEEMKIVGNQTIRYIRLERKNLSPQDCQILVAARWNNLTSLYLGSNCIGDQGCAYLIKAEWKRLISLSLTRNQIGAQGCANLVKGDWKSLTTLDLEENTISDQGCAQLIKAEWKSLKFLNLGNNSIEAEGCSHLIKAEWKSLTSLILRYNRIKSQGCKHLIKAEWNNLTSLNLWENQIVAQGCLYLAKSEWKILSNLNLGKNKIGAQGCAHLVKAEWKNMVDFSLWGNQIGDQGCAHLVKSDWKNLTSLDLRLNKIGAEGCAHLIKADWKSLRSLLLSANRIGHKGCEHLTKGEWKNLSYLYLGDSHIDKSQMDSLRQQFNNQNLQIQW